MANVTPDRILDKFRRLHTRLKGSGATVTIVKYTNTVTDDHALPSDTDEDITTITPQPIVEDQPGEDLQAAFGTSISQDHRIFRFVTDTLVARAPTSTLEKRAYEFIAERTGRTRGGILYGDELYIIEKVHVTPIIGGVPAWFVILAKAAKKKVV